MKIIYTEKELKEILVEHVSDVLPVNFGDIKLNINEYSDNYCTIEIVGE